MNESERTIIVTGASRGLGREVSRQLAEQGYRVVLTARKQADAERAAAEMSGAGLVLPRQLDVASAASVRELASALVELGPIAGLVNNAGISLQGFDSSVVRTTLAVNFFGALSVTEALAPQIVDGGTIVMVSSGMGELSAYSAELRARFLSPSLDVRALVHLVDELDTDVKLGRHAARGWPSSAYRVSKAALNALARIEARERPHLRVNAICPGWVKTDMGGSGASRSVEHGARGIVWAATLSAEGPSGGFFRDRKPIAW
jgi:NAD(P)-dependent dehydrogenase (short-subunit alcohol dehydrogenase family)